jgi:hypothetical protein
MATPMTKLTDEQLDDMDCRPGGQPAGIQRPAWVQQAIKEAEADRAR